jgi:tripartite-type tricarboxylate transporter receptor subunit TctC
MKLPRRRFLHLAASTATLPTVTRLAWAQRYPERPVHIVVGYAPGGGNDIAARLIGEWLSERLGQPFVVENRPGAGSNIATEAVVRAPADGHTLLLTSLANAANGALYDKLSYDFMRDVAPVAALLRVSNLVAVHPSVPAQTLPDFIAYARANPGKVNVGSGPIGGPVHMTGALFNLMTGLKMQNVPYRGEALALADLIAGAGAGGVR